MPPPVENNSLADSRPMFGMPLERRGNNLNCFEDLCLKKGSSQGQNRALTVVSVPYSLVSGLANADDPPCRELLSGD